MATQCLEPSPRAGKWRPGPRPTVAYYSLTAENPKLHLDVRCVGLERVEVSPRSNIGHHRFVSLTALSRSELGRPCRVCALERVLDSVLRPVRPKNQRSYSFATFSSQGNPHEGIEQYAWRASTDTGAERLSRVLARCGLPSVLCAHGPAGWGFFPPDGINALQRNLRCYVRDDIVTDPGPGAIQTLWSLLDDNPVELDSALEEATERPDPLELATLLAG